MIIANIHVNAVTIGQRAAAAPTNDAEEVPPSLDVDHVRTAGIALASVSAARAKAGAKHVIGDRARRQRPPTRLRRHQGKTHLLERGEMRGKGREGVGE